MHDATTEPNPLLLLAKDSDNYPIITPQTILNTPWVDTDNGPHLQVLVQWVGLPVDDTSWEDWASLKEEYHIANKVILKGLKVMDQSTCMKPSTEGLRGRSHLCNVFAITFKC